MVLPVRNCTMSILTTGLRCLRLQQGQGLLRAISASFMSASPTLPRLPSITSAHCLHTSAALEQKKGRKLNLPEEPKGWLEFNDIVYPPRKEGEPIRPAEVTHHRANIKYSGKKLWYIGLMIRGLSIDEAIKQLAFYKRKGAHIVLEMLEEAQEMAVNDHNVEFKSNLWVADAFHKNAMIIRGLRKGSRGRHTMIRYRYTHFFLRLREGPPPKHYYPPVPTGHEKMETYIEGLRDRHIHGGL